MNSAPPYPRIDQAAPKSGIVALRNGVERYFQSYSVPAIVAPVGLKYRSFTINQASISNANRVVFIPGEFDGAAKGGSRRYGSLNRNNRNSASVVNPRELLSWDRPITISVWSAPQKGSAENEQDSVALVEDLLEQVVRGVQYAAMATVEWGAVVISTAADVQFGTELLVSLIQTGPIFDITLDVISTQQRLPRGA